ncbi:L-seryl-tRNA(Sec) selenium transferase [Sulfitobacter alexandrii]|uniref:L-seryl-tRNA(Sec) selenium transferase n=1 Tax=Sulfitobacter alexandrii TaxID=1917485 RepID=A0A1J0WMA0_9RHOB|nr:L-seryl-tRNA(Sec) selenium transferase [Sulfitobacter alexandrii]
MPQIEALLSYPTIAALVDSYSRAETVAALRREIADQRAALLGDSPPDTLPDFSGPSFADGIAARIEADRLPALRSVVNATGVIIHTNLGRARLAPEAVAAMAAAGADATNLELDLESGKRGSRHAHVEALIRELTGAEAAVVVNNCAAAVLLGLMATAGGRSVIASRGELVEIGGSFRLPDVIAQSGAALREVGTTNRTRVSDYEAAIDDTTAVLLKSHASNFRIIGFTSAPDRRALARLAQDNRLIMMEDLGSGVLVDLSPYGLADEPVVAQVLDAGADLVMFSGDKLLGGPQAGIIAGRAKIVAQLKAHPLMRALRIDKLSLAALEATLRLYRAPHDPMKAVPVLRMLSDPIETVAARAAALTDALRAKGLRDLRTVDSTARVGGGSLPEQDLPSVALSVAVDGLSADGLAAALRHGKVPVVARIAQGRVLLDLRTIQDCEVPQVADAFAAVLRS